LPRVAPALLLGYPICELCAWGNVAQNSSNDAGPVKPVDGYDASF